MSYFEEGFDPSKQTVSRLSSILSSHGIQLPVTRQKKQFYVDLFNNQLAPKAHIILKNMASVVPSNKGITFVSPKSKIPIKKSPLKERTPNESKTQTPAKYPLLPKEVIEELVLSQKSRKPIEISPYRSIEAKRNLVDEELDTPSRPSIISKKMKTVPDFSLGEQKEDDSKPPTPVQIRKQRYLDSLKLDENFKAPKTDRFMIIPGLPGVRATVPETNVRELVGKLNKETEKEMKNTFSRSSSDETLTGVINDRDQEENPILENWDNREIHRVMKSSSNNWLIFFIIISTAILFVYFQSLVVANIENHFPNEYNQMKKYFILIEKDKINPKLLELKQIVEKMVDRIENQEWRQHIALAFQNIKKMADLSLLKMDAAIRIIHREVSILVSLGQKSVLANVQAFSNYFDEYIQPLISLGNATVKSKFSSMFNTENQNQLKDFIHGYYLVLLKKMVKILNMSADDWRALILELSSVVQEFMSQDVKISMSTLVITGALFAGGFAICAF